MWHGRRSDAEPRNLETIPRGEGTVFTSLPATAWTYERRSSTSSFPLLVLRQSVGYGSDVTPTIPRSNRQNWWHAWTASVKIYSQQVNNIVSASGHLEGGTEEHQHPGRQESKFVTWHKNEMIFALNPEAPAYFYLHLTIQKHNLSIVQHWKTETQRNGKCHNIKNKDQPSLHFSFVPTSDI